MISGCASATVFLKLASDASSRFVDSYFTFSDSDNVVDARRINTHLPGDCEVFRTPVVWIFSPVHGKQVPITLNKTLFAHSLL